MKIVYFFGLLLLSTGLFAQEIPMRSTPIDRSESKSTPLPTTVPVPKSTNPFIKNVNTGTSSSSKKEEEKPKFSMYTDNGLLTAGDYIEQKWTEDKKSSEPYKQDQYLGDFKTTGKFVEIYCRDYQYVDGDRVKVSVNGKVVQPDITLPGGYIPVLVNLESGFNMIEIEALNQGTSGPNTAAFKVFGENGELITENEWNLLTGAKASLIIVKQ
ncbi:MAG: hypothetical protein WCD31_05870 [Gillisia sp.]